MLRFPVPQSLELLRFYKPLLAFISVAKIFFLWHFSYGLDFQTYGGRQVTLDDTYHPDYGYFLSI